MLAFVIDIYVVFENHVFQQSVGIIMGTDCAPSLADLFLYSYEAEMFQRLVHETKSLPVTFTRHLGILTTYYQLTIDISILTSDRYITVNLK